MYYTYFEKALAERQAYLSKLWAGSLEEINNLPPQQGIGLLASLEREVNTVMEWTNTSKGPLHQFDAHIFSLQDAREEVTKSGGSTPTTVEKSTMPPPAMPSFATLPKGIPPALPSGAAKFSTM